jgi:3-deoxy-manno-octulosonate cytidylyltransferase (CMP-KDO synthetase)
VSTLIVIPARLGSARLPEKPLRLLGGRPLISRVAERVLELGLGDAVAVAGDDEAILAAVAGLDVRGVLTRRDHPSGTDRVAEVASRAEFLRYDVIVNVQGDEPFVSRDAVRVALSTVLDDDFPVGTVACPDQPDILGDPSVVKVVRADDGRALYFSRAAVPCLRDAEDTAIRDALVLRHIGLYAYRRDALRRWVALPPSPLEQVERLEQLRPLAAGIPIGVGVVGNRPLPGIDTEDDLRRANDAWPRGTALDTPPSHAGYR